MTSQTTDALVAEQRAKRIARSRRYNEAHRYELREKNRIAARKRRADPNSGQKEKDKAWKAANKDRVRAARLARYAANPEKSREATYRHRKNNPEKIKEFRRARYYADVEGAREKSRNSHLRSKYGITNEQYEEMLQAQGGKCAVCGELETRRRLSIDHDHRTGQTRKLLCSTCNVMEGYFKRDLARSVLVAKYADANACEAAE